MSRRVVKSLSNSLIQGGTVPNSVRLGVCQRPPLISARRLSSSRAIPSKRPRSIHSSAKKKQPTSTLDFVHSNASPAEGIAAVDAFPTTQAISAPSRESLKALFLASAIPMLGFGFMDNFVMIQAGQYIDSTLGVQLGLATMTAAAAGQVVSDVSGVLFGGSLERFLSRLGLVPQTGLSSTQRQLPVCRNVSMAGAVVGVMIGCALGACTLLTVDLKARERLEKTQTLTDLVTALVKADELDCRRVTIYVPQMEGLVEESQGATASTSHTTSLSTQLVSLESSSKAQLCAESRETTVEDGFRLLLPVLEGDSLVAVLELEKNSSLSQNDIETATRLAKHVGVVMGQLAD